MTRSPKRLEAARLEPPHTTEWRGPLGLTLPNPAGLGAWVAIATVLWPSATTSIAVSLALGVGIGSAAWFTLLGRIVAKVSPDHRALKIVPTRSPHRLRRRCTHRWHPRRRS